MSRLTAAPLDLSRLGAPELLQNTDYETILAARKADFVARAATYGLDYDVVVLESDPMVALIEEDAYREMLDLAAINAAGEARMLAFAAGTDLDHLGALFGVLRLDGEADDRFRRRIQAAPDAFGTAGAPAAYEYFALTADVRVQDVAVLNYATLPSLKPGQVAVIIAAPDDVIDDVLTNVRAALFRTDVRPLTDMVSVRKARQVTYAIDAVIQIPRGPDPALVLTEARARLALYQSDRHRIGSIIAHSGLDACFHVRVADRVVITAPSGDVDPGADGMAVCSAVNLTTSIALV